MARERARISWSAGSTINFCSLRQITATSQARPGLAVSYTESCRKILPRSPSLKTETIDVMLEIPPAAYRHYAEDPQWKSSVIVAPGLNIYYLGLNCQAVPFNNPLIRRALNYAIDREAMVAAFLTAGDALPPARCRRCSGPALPPAGYSYDPARARGICSSRQDTARGCQ